MDFEYFEQNPTHFFGRMQETSNPISNSKKSNKDYSNKGLKREKNYSIIEIFLSKTTNISDQCN